MPIFRESRGKIPLLPAFALACFLSYRSRNSREFRLSGNASDAVVESDDIRIYVNRTKADDGIAVFSHACEMNTVI